MDLSSSSVMQQLRYYCISISTYPLPTSPACALQPWVESGGIDHLTGVPLAVPIWVSHRCYSGLAWQFDLVSANQAVFAVESILKIALSYVQAIVSLLKIIRCTVSWCPLDVYDQSRWITPSSKHPCWKRQSPQDTERPGERSVACLGRAGQRVCHLPSRQLSNGRTKHCGHIAHYPIYLSYLQEFSSIPTHKTTPPSYRVL